MYDIFYIKIAGVENTKISNLRNRFPLLKVAEYTVSKSEAIEKAKRRSLTKFFWIIDSDFEVNDDFMFDYVVTEWDIEYVHVWKNLVDYGGVYLLSKDQRISKREADHLFFINKKEISTVASYAIYDIVFISYNEVNADENWEYLINRFPRAKRVHGVKGIHNAHRKAAEISATTMFWVVDGDSRILENFNLDYYVPHWNRDSVFVWKSQNPVNDLVYGYGGLKLLPRYLTLNIDTSTVDMTTSISKKFNPMDGISNLTVFNTDPFNTWKSAFRECVKLSSKVIDGQVDDETEMRLTTWCTVGFDKPYGEFSIKGALMGKEFGIANSKNIDELAKINNWEWLTSEFNKL